MHAVITVFPLFRFTVSQLTIYVNQDVGSGVLFRICITCLFPSVLLSYSYWRNTHWILNRNSRIKFHTFNFFRPLSHISFQSFSFFRPTVLFIPLPAFIYAFFLPFFFLLLSKKLHAIFFRSFIPFLPFLLSYPYSFSISLFVRPVVIPLHFTLTFKTS